MQRITPELARMARVGLGLSLKEVADKVELHVNTIQRYEAYGNGSKHLEDVLETFYLNNGVAFISPEHDEQYGLSGPGVRLLQDVDPLFLSYWRNRFSGMSFSGWDQFCETNEPHPDRAYIHAMTRAQLAADAIQIDASLGVSYPEQSLAILMKDVEREYWSKERRKEEDVYFYLSSFYKCLLEILARKDRFQAIKKSN